MSIVNLKLSDKGDEAEILFLGNDNNILKPLISCFLCQDEQISLDKPSSGGGGLREPASLAHSAYSLAASAFSSQDTQLYINGAGLSYGYRGYPGLGAAMQHPVSLTTGAAAQSNGEDGRAADGGGEGREEMDKAK